MISKVSFSQLKLNKGFTLIELLIAISILSLLMFSGSYSYSLLASRWDKELGNFSSTYTESKHLQLLQNVLEGTYSFIVTDNENNPSFFFIGKADSLLSITHGSIFDTEYPEVYRITAVRNKEQKLDLVYQALSTKTFLLLKTEQNIEFERNIILFENLDYVKFNFFGWQNGDQKSLSGDQKILPKWFNEFSGIDNKLLPIKYEITIGRNSQNIVIPVQMDERAELLLSAYYEEH